MLSIDNVLLTKMILCSEGRGSKASMETFLTAGS